MSFSPKYTRLGPSVIPQSCLESHNSAVESDGFLEKTGPGMKDQLSWPKKMAFALTQTSLNLVWTLLLLLTTFLALLSKEYRGPCVEWHDTDIEPARRHIERIPVKFTSGLYWNETTGDTTYRTWNEGEPVFVGPRTPELDAAWDDISLRVHQSFTRSLARLLMFVEALDLYVTEEEAIGISDIPQGMYQDPETGKYM
ncbi:hypothetical protein MMC27_008804, partial [Xylographa pallens]|nr:hypothetical protein [Xylographa pallens]